MLVDHLAEHLRAAALNPPHATREDEAAFTVNPRFPVQGNPLSRAMLDPLQEEADFETFSALAAARPYRRRTIGGSFWVDFVGLSPIPRSIGGISDEFRDSRRSRFAEADRRIGLTRSPKGDQGLRRQRGPDVRHQRIDKIRGGFAGDRAGTA